MKRNKVALSINSTWNVVNFRAGLVRALLEEGYEVFILTPRDASGPRLRGMGIEHYHLPMKAHSISPGWDIILFLRYLYLLIKVRPACFLGYTVKPNIYGSLAAHSLHVPVINNVAGLGTVFNRQNWLSKLVQSLYRLAFRKSKVVFFQNPDDRELFTRERLVNEGQARLLPGSGVDLARFAPVQRQATSGRHFTFLLVARLLWSKGIGEFIEAASVLKRSTRNVHFQIAGIIDGAHPDGVPKASVDTWVADGIIEYLGALDDVRPRLAAADCVVLPSYYPEGTPRALLEAAAMGKPLITTDMPGCRNTVDDGVNGYLCVPRDAPSLVKAMQQILDLPADAYAAFEAASRRKAVTEFDERLVISRYLEALHDVIGPGSASSSSGADVNSPKS